MILAPSGVLSEKNLHPQAHSNVVRFYFSYIGVITDENTTDKDLVYKICRQKT